ncbi:RNA polymerase sigma factor [Ornithinibacillus bavariensis]|uniref:RNA polymerase sigma factor n=1 Tax=Ornithinibacillus bavariensis TaxID=545502 RepID=UPI000ECB03F3|nr:RNA polymerase sigma factor [Ornithinibacillus sp.]
MDQHVGKQRISDWYLAYSNDIYNYIYFLVSDHELAKDILQDTFLRAYRNINSFKGDNVRGWLFRIARNVTIDDIRKKKPIASLLDSFSLLNANEPSPEEMAILNETEKELYLSLSKLKLSYRDVIVLRKIKEFSISETAEILGWTEKKVKVTLFRAIKALRKELGKENFSHETI